MSMRMKWIDDLCYKLCTLLFFILNFAIRLSRVLPELNGTYFVLNSAEDYPSFYFLGFGLLELPQWVLPELNGTYFVLNSAESCPRFYFLGFSLLELPNESSPSWTGRTSCWTQPNLTRVFIFWVLDFWNFPMIVERFCLNLEVWEILFWIN